MYTLKKKKKKKTDIYFQENLTSEKYKVIMIMTILP